MSAPGDYKTAAPSNKLFGVVLGTQSCTNQHGDQVVQTVWRDILWNEPCIPWIVHPDSTDEENLGYLFSGESHPIDVTAIIIPLRSFADEDVRFTVCFGGKDEKDNVKVELVKFVCPAKKFREEASRHWTNISSRLAACLPAVVYANDAIIAKIAFARLINYNSNGHVKCLSKNKSS